MEKIFKSKNTGIQIEAKRFHDGPAIDVRSFDIVGGKYCSAPTGLTLTRQTAQELVNALMRALGTLPGETSPRTHKNLWPNHKRKIEYR